MARKRPDHLETAIEQALEPGTFVGYRDDWEFVEDLEAVRSQIVSLIKDGEARRAAGLLETFIAGCYGKSEEIDDSSGTFGTFVGELFCDWIRARQAAGTSADETAATLLSWMENDDYGYCYQLEEEAVKVLNRDGLTALERAVKVRPPHGRESSLGRDKVAILKAIHVKRGDVDAYVALCEHDRGISPRDCEVLAEICLKRRRPKDALAWVERGLGLGKKAEWPNRTGRDLPDLRRQIFKKLGRDRDALEAAWEEYRKDPSVFAYDDLMKYVPKGKRSTWHSKAISALDGADLAARIEILVKTRETEHLAALVGRTSRKDLMDLSHYTTEPAAKKLLKSHPLLAARIHVALGLRILEAKKSKYSHAALEDLERARRILSKQKRKSEWDDLVAEIREKHRRKSGFMSGFERLVEGGRAKREPSVLEQAKKKWGSRGPGRTRAS